MAQAINWIIPIAGIAAILFALYLARGCIAQDQGTQAMQDVAATIYEGAVAFIRRQYVTIGVLALVASVIVGAVIAIVNTPEVERHHRQWCPAGHLHRDRVPGRRRLLDGVGHHRHVHQRQGQPAHRCGGASQPGRRGAGRDARRRGLGLPRGRPVAAGRVRHLRRPSVASTTLPRRRSSSSASASAPRSWRCSPSSAAASTPRPRTSAPTSWARSRRASPRTTRATRASSRTSSATTSATAPAVAPTCSSRPQPRTSGP